MANLGTKESGLFKTAIQLYEIKQYKKGLKTCEQILIKYPEHGETLALKGLFLLFMDKREEGFDTCKKGLKLSLQSHISWHILGLMHRQDKNYEEAIKCYKNALRIDKDNFQILRDLALLQLQCRQLEGAIDTRRKIIFTRPSSPFNWISLVVIYHLSGNLKQALEILDIYLYLFGKIKDDAENHRFYKVTIMMELGLFDEVIEYLKSFKNQNTRRFYEALAAANLSSKNFAIAEEIVWKLIDINPDCRDYIAQIFNIYISQNKDITSLFDTIQSKSLLAAVEALCFLDIDLFRLKAPIVFKSIMERGSPATFQLFKFLLGDELRKETIWKCILEMDQENSNVIVFKTKLLAYNKDYISALDLINSALKTNPDNSDFKLIKAHIQKKMGCTKDANETIIDIKESILNDKFSVSKSAKYMIRYGSISEAQEMMGKFIQKPNQVERMGDLHEMQAVWYLIEMADRLFKDGNILSAACFYRKIELIFAEFIDDQLDFHGYSLRRMSFVEYIKFLRFLDSELKNSEILSRALIGLSRCLMNFEVNSVDVASLTTKLESTNISSQFSDDISSHLEYFRTLISSQKGIDESLHRICNNLINHNPENTEALLAAFKIALKLNSMLTAQKLAIVLIEKGVEISDEDIKLINEHRTGDSDSLWQHVPLLT